MLRTGARDDAQASSSRRIRCRASSCPSRSGKLPRPSGARTGRPPTRAERHHRQGGGTESPVGGGRHDEKPPIVAPQNDAAIGDSRIAHVASPEFEFWPCRVHRTGAADSDQNGFAPVEPGWRCGLGHRVCLQGLGCGHRAADDHAVVLRTGQAGRVGFEQVIDRDLVREICAVNRLGVTWINAAELHMAHPWVPSKNDVGGHARMTDRFQSPRRRRR